MRIRIVNKSSLLTAVVGSISSISEALGQALHLTIQLASIINVLFGDKKEVYK